MTQDVMLIIITIAELVQNAGLIPPQLVLQTKELLILMCALPESLTDCSLSLGSNFKELVRQD
jgi:hypothetical protein